jgi:hypothetical protein
LPLIVNAYSAAFIRLDTRAINEMLGVKEKSDPFALQKYFCLHSVRANVPTMRRRHGRKYGTSKKGFFDCLRLSGKRCPWILGASVMTDGVQLKALLTTVRDHNLPTPGVDQLPKAGYQLSAKREITLNDALLVGKGVYNIKAVRGSEEELSDVAVTAIDPGQVRVVEYRTMNGSEWRRDNAPHLMTQSNGFSADDYKEQTLQNKANRNEERRREKNDQLTSYGSAIRFMSRFTMKGTLTDFLDYCTAWAEVEEVFSKELFETLHRSVQRFYRFKATQSTIAKIADSIVPLKMKGQRRIVCLGNGNCKHAKGAAPAPRKKLAGELAQRAVKLITPENYTSQTCPACLRKTETGTDYRTRRCETKPESRYPCPLHLNTLFVEFDRDVAGFVNIGIRACEMICGTFNGSYKPKTYD